MLKIHQHSTTLVSTIGARRCLSKGQSAVCLHVRGPGWSLRTSLLVQPTQMLFSCTSMNSVVFVLRSLRRFAFFFARTGMDRKRCPRRYGYRVYNFVVRSKMAPLYVFLLSHSQRAAYPTPTPHPNTKVFCCVFYSVIDAVKTRKKTNEHNRSNYMYADLEVKW